MTHYRLSWHYMKIVLNRDSIIREQTANVNVNFTVWHTTKMFGATCAPTSHPQFCIMSTGHVWFTSLLTLHTPLL